MFATVPEIVTFTSASFASTFCMFAETAVPSTTAPKLSVIPPAEKSTVAAFVASAIAAPDAAVAVSFTVMVSAFVAFDAASDVKPSRSAELPSIVAVTVPVVAFISAFRPVTLPALMFATVPEIVTFTSASFASTFCMFAETAVPSTTAPKLSVIPPAEKSTVAAFVASAIAAPDATVAVSLTVMVYA